MEGTENLAFFDVEGQILDTASRAVPFRQSLNLNGFHETLVSIDSSANCPRMSTACPAKI